MGAALHLAYVEVAPPGPKRKRKRKRGGGSGGGDDKRPFIIIPTGACDACADHWHHKCYGVNLFLDPRPDCPCPCGDPADPTGARMSPAAWADLAQHCPEIVPQAVQGQRIRDGVGVFLCAETRREARW